MIIVITITKLIYEMAAAAYGFYIYSSSFALLALHYYITCCLMNITHNYLRLSN